MSKASTQAERLLMLDVLRSSAVLFVVFYHYGSNYLWEQTFVEQLQKTMWFGVDIFFVLSGYLITRSWVNDISTTNSLKKSFQNFYLKRSFRILPCYLLILSIYVMISLIKGKDVAYYKYFLFIQNFGSPEIFIPSWSLCVEEHFYLFAPVLILYFSRISRSSIISFSLFIVFLSTLVRFITANYFLGNNFPQSPFELESIFYYPTYMRLDGLGVGVFVALIEKYYPKTWDLISKKYRIFGALGLSLIIPSIIFVMDRYHANTLVFGFLFLSISIGFILIYSLNTPLNKKNNFFFSWTSKISYSMYLTFHFAQLSMYLIQKYLKIELTGSHHLLISFLLFYLFALALYFSCERPSLKIRRKFILS